MCLASPGELKTYGEVERYFLDKGSTNAFYEAMDVMKSRHP